MRTPDTKREAALRRGLYAAMAMKYILQEQELMEAEYVPKNYIEEWQKEIKLAHQLAEKFAKKAGIKEK